MIPDPIFGKDSDIFLRLLVSANNQFLPELYEMRNFLFHTLIYLNYCLHPDCYCYNISAIVLSGLLHVYIVFVNLPGSIIVRRWTVWTSVLILFVIVTIFGWSCTIDTMTRNNNFFYIFFFSYYIRLSTPDHEYWKKL